MQVGVREINRKKVVLLACLYFLTPEEQTKRTGVGVVQVTVSGDLHLFFSLILKLF